jgi:phosphoenolpyruvate synthase/pyruvate phosphate dikinase
MRIFSAFPFPTKFDLCRLVYKLAEFQPGEVLVAEITDPDWEPIMKIASAIVTNSGGRTSHAAIVSRELGIPAIVGCGNATTAIPNGQDITVSCTDGEVGNVYQGILKFRIDSTDIANFELPKTDIKMIVASPELVFNYSQIPNTSSLPSAVAAVLLDVAEVVEPVFPAVWSRTVSIEAFA